MSKITLAVLDTKLDHLTEQVDALHHTVCGNGKEGLVIEVDRLKQRQYIRDWVIGSILVPLIATVIGTIIAMVF